MQFIPRTEEEIKRDRLCPAGVYPFTTIESKEQASKSQKNNGKMMFALKQSVHTNDGDCHVQDYFADWFNAHKLRHYFFVTGQIEQYETGSVDANNNAFNGLTGYLKIKIVDPKPGDQYGPKNEIVDYLTQEEYDKELAKIAAEAAEEKPAEPDLEDPFA